MRKITHSEYARIAREVARLVRRDHPGREGLYVLDRHGLRRSFDGTEKSVSVTWDEWHAFFDTRTSPFLSIHNHPQRHDDDFPWSWISEADLFSTRQHLKSEHPVIDVMVVNDQTAEYVLVSELFSEGLEGLKPYLIKDTDATHIVRAQPKEIKCARTSTENGLRRSFDGTKRFIDGTWDE